MTDRRNGAGPATARSALGLRTWLAAFGVIVSGVTTLWLVDAARGQDDPARTALTILAGVAFLGVVVGVADLVVLGPRRRRR